MVRISLPARDISLFHKVQNGSETHPVSYSMCTGVLSRGVRQPGREDLQVVPRLRMSAPPYMPSKRGTNLRKTLLPCQLYGIGQIKTFEVIFNTRNYVTALTGRCLWAEVCDW